MAEEPSHQDLGGEEGGEEAAQAEGDSRFNAPLVKYCLMNEDMKQECAELCVTAVEKFPQDLESAAKFIKGQMDDKYGASWQIVVGEQFGLQVTYESQNLLYMYVGGNTCVGVWKCP